MRFKLSLVLLLLVKLSFSQHYEDVSDYVKKDTISTFHQQSVIKFLPSQLYSGEICFAYEKSLNKKYSIQGSLGYQLPYFYDLLEWSDYSVPQPEYGFGISLEARSYYVETSPLFIYFGCKAGSRLFFPNAYNITDISSIYGIQIGIYHNLYLDLAYHLGLRFYPTNNYYKVDLLMDFEIGLGIPLN